jgi:bisphosphoglycerate-independent phosphoglycerate mutase (AlkP superfamily)
MPAVLKPLIGRIKRRLGFGVLRPTGRTAEEILENAKPTLHDQRRGLIVLHWPDADRAGHRFGWMSEPYGAAARRMDETLGRLAEFCAIPHDASTLLVLLADHGGGGVREKDHSQEHPVNRRIFVAMCGGGVAPTQLRDVTMLDLAPTILWVLGHEPPPMYEGRVLDEAFPLGETFSRPALETPAVA